MYQFRTRATWHPDNKWSEWKECTQGSYNDYIKTPLLHDWAYETRKLFAEPFDIEPPRFAKRLIQQLRDELAELEAKVGDAAYMCEINASMFDTDERGVMSANVFRTIKQKLTK